MIKSKNLLCNAFHICSMGFRFGDNGYRGRCRILTSSTHWWMVIALSGHLLLSRMLNLRTMNLIGCWTYSSTFWTVVMFPSTIWSCIPLLNWHPVYQAVRKECLLALKKNILKGLWCVEIQYQLPEIHYFDLPSPNNVRKNKWHFEQCWQPLLYQLVSSLERSFSQ